MRLELHRRKRTDTATFGELFVDGVFECLTLEDVVRADGVKVWDATAIPAGTYKVILNMSPRFKRIMPRLLGVPMFDGILIHKGNRSAETHGCILVGTTIAGPDLLTHSTEAFDKLFPKLKTACDSGQSVEIVITNDFREVASVD